MRAQLGLLRAVFNHLVLPPQIPNEPDEDPEAVSHDILSRFIHACRNVVNAHVGEPWTEAFQSLQSSLETCLILNRCQLEKKTVLDHLRRFDEDTTLILHVAEQNAALLIRYDTSELEKQVIFESFETSAVSEKVLAASQALQWDFPGHSVRLPYAEFADEEFQKSLATFLEQATTESLYNLSAQAQKAKVSVIETRDTADPALITQMLMPLLESMGSRFDAPVLRKRVRDDVNHGKGDFPWRRLPFWLVLRVAAQRQLGLRLDCQQGRIAYKVLMGTLLAKLLDDVRGNLDPHLVVRLRAKLGRRMAKLELELEMERKRSKSNPKSDSKSDSKSDPTTARACDVLFAHFRPVIETAIKEATAQVETAWEAFKRASTPHIPTLHWRAPASALTLSLPNSGRYLDRLLANPRSKKVVLPSLTLPNPLDHAITQAQKFTDHVFQLASTEASLEASLRDDGLPKKAKVDHETRCQQLSRQIAQVFSQVGTTYNSDPEQMSAMILAVFALWVRLDECAVAACPLLADYQPPFTAGLLDVLQLPTLEDMFRLQAIQKYIAQRRSSAKYGTIFAHVHRNCLAVRYVASSEPMKHTQARIQLESYEARNLKELEWRKALNEYNKHVEGFANGTCACTWKNGQRDSKGCTKCWHRRARKRMKIQVEEAYLPDDDLEKAFVVFELAIPTYLAAYRDATWRIVRDLAHPSRPLRTSPVRIALRDCGILGQFMTPGARAVSLASTVKCFNQTHYKFNPVNIPIDRVFVPLAARFELFDHDSGIWVRDLSIPLTLQHHCGVYIPRALKTTVLPGLEHPKPDMEELSSYQVQANQVQCPSNMSVHEFSAHQKLLAGPTRRWLQILVELGSANLNLSNEETTRMLCQLVIQAGPQSDHVLRTTHIVFQEPAFVNRLIQLIEERMHAIHTNWREHNCMELLITLSLRLFDLSSGPTRLRAEALLKLARSATLDWTIKIRNVVATTKGAEAAHQITIYGCCAALLCRRTFTIHSRLKKVINSQDLKVWIQASLALQENMLVGISSLSPALKSMLIRDIKMTYHLQYFLRTAVVTHPTSVSEAICSSWSDASDGAVMPFSTWKFLSSPHERWVVATKTTAWGSFKYTEVVHCNVVEGHLLVNGKPRGKLPLEIRNSAVVTQMFGDQHLLTYPSTLPGMTYRLVTLMSKQEVHFGLVDQTAIIRTCGRDSMFEFIPRGIFTSGTSFDIPMELLESCTHWLNLDTGDLEVRRSPAIWGKRPRDWVIDVPKRRALRGGNVSLVDPGSDIFRQITGILGSFERPDRLTVYQPASLGGRLSIDARHMELSFYVNDSCLLECRQLKAEIDPNQDAGTLYGLRSKIVLRDLISRKRSIIVPLGVPNIRRQGMHVEVRINDALEYGRYTVDEDLGRLLCPPEPRLIYMKAYCHAVTSFCLPDTLTGRTGTEEALHILQSGAAQPWVPLGNAAHPILKAIEALAPRREYYPPNLKRIQKIIWEDNLTPTIQHDGFESLVYRIMVQSNQLREFATNSTGVFDCSEPTYLRSRGEAHRRIYERPSPNSDSRVIQDIIYAPRDRGAMPRAHKVYEMAQLVATSCSSMSMHRTLKTALESYEFIGGFNTQYSSYNLDASLIERIENPINEQWGDLVNFCRRATNKAPVLFRLGLLAFGPKADMDIIRSLVAMFTIHELKSLSPPASSSFVDFRSRGRPPLQLLEKLIVPAHKRFQPRSNLKKPTAWDSYGRDAEEHKALCEEEGRGLALHILNQWPASVPRLTGFPATEGIDTTLALEHIRKEWIRRQRNDELNCFIDKVQKTLASVVVPQHANIPLAWKTGKLVFRPGQYHRVIPSVKSEFLGKTGPYLDKPVCILLENHSRAARGGTSGFSRTMCPPELIKLKAILEKFAATCDRLRRQYANDLLQSLSALEGVRQPLQSEPQYTGFNLLVIKRAVEEARDIVGLYFEEICTAFTLNDSRFAWLQMSGIWPCTTPTEVLEVLRSKASNSFGPGMKESLISYGLAITMLQKLDRIRSAQLRKDWRAIKEELLNSGHENWEPMLRPDWLLLEIDSNFLIRAEQVEVANAIIKPPSGGNSVLQMNMGKGKTSCIVPMVMAVLADGKNLSRLIVPKALLMQTAQTMQWRLGSLVGRRVCHIPFSRKTPTSPQILELYAKIHRQTREERGLILTSQEHVLSFKLGGWQQLTDGNLPAATTMINFQAWLDNHCRDVLDECDFTLSVKTQLNYPGGTEASVDGHPYRWQVAEGLLALVAHHIPVLWRMYPDGIEVLERPGSFPMIRFVKSGVEDVLRDWILDDICAGRATFLQPADATFARKSKLIRQALSTEKFNDCLFKQAAAAFSNSKAASKILLVVRGLLMDGILTLCLDKRWNVQYGLHPHRDPIAVPYEAKGTPSEQSEFGHPDVAILFTCLAFYYSGLTLKQFSQGLSHVLQSDDPAAQYEWWISGCGYLPEALRHWNVINVEDQEQINELWKNLHLDRIVIDHFLNHCVFPVYAKQFEVKLQASAWDTVLFSDGQKEARTTGFSGTNDNRVMLPLSIQQNDLPSLRQTSAEVLSYILQKRNRNYEVIVDQRGKRRTERGFLEQLTGEGIRVLIDAGAYILEMDNASLAKEWLSVDYEASAAIYYKNDNRAWVTFRSSTKDDVPLIATPYADDLSDCLVYLDEAHTRGVDLKLPAYARGALTLALKQTKDYTVQAAMRLRQLHTTQSITFFAPLEVNQSIRDFCRPAEFERIDSSHVISWLLEQTCRTNEDMQNLYIAQGIDFCRRTDAVWRNPQFLTHVDHREKLLRVLQQPERQTLEQLYGGDLARMAGSMGQMSAPKLQGFREQLIRPATTSTIFRAGALEIVEQERENQVQVEQVRQLQKRPDFEALTFPGPHPAILKFVRTGLLDTTMLSQGSCGIEHAFSCIARTTLGKRFGVRATTSKLYVSKEFGRTIKSNDEQMVADNFLRPVEWILWRPSTQTALVVIPEEVEKIIPEIRSTGHKSAVYLIAYASPVTKAMLPFNKFDYYSLPKLPAGHVFPEWFRVELGILAGRLYVDFDEWDSVSNFLRQPTQVSNGSPGSKSIRPETVSRFAEDGTGFVMEWLALRRRTQNILHTPMGYICTGRTPEPGHSFRQVAV
ncbi:hypothetical protein F4775DRAFT_48634 [Biscogniauxia sp. FL1348]|nr:hypothetical protein F4775DRAFT_48634 [Biscogniauxia sp. FL1348]